MAADSIRVLHLVHGVRVGGKERVVLDLARRARALGHDDRILSFEALEARPRGGGAAGDSGRAGAGAPPEFDCEGVPVIALNRLPGRPGLRARALAVRAQLRAEPPLVLHAHNDAALVLASLALGPRSDVRRIATLHNLPVPRHGLRARLASLKDRRLVRWAARRFDGLVCVSHELRGARAPWIGASEVIYNGVDLQRFTPDGASLDHRAALGLPPDALIVGMVARFDVGKRQADLLAAAHIAQRRGLGIGVVLAGDGPLLERVRAACPSSLPARFLPHEPDVAALLRGTDVVALASDHEGLPMSLLEALAAGRAVVASDVGGVPELLGRGVERAGILTPPRDVDALASALMTLGDPHTRAALAARGRARVVAEFDLERACAAYEALYR
ncbi:MAG: glycosyltransferase [Planctomycetota bacterium]